MSCAARLGRQGVQDPGAPAHHAACHSTQGTMQLLLGLAVSPPLGGANAHTHLQGPSQESTKHGHCNSGHCSPLTGHHVQSPHHPRCVHRPGQPLPSRRPFGGAGTARCWWLAILASAVTCLPYTPTQWAHTGPCVCPTNGNRPMPRPQLLAGPGFRMQPPLPHTHTPSHHGGCPLPQTSALHGIDMQPCCQLPAAIPWPVLACKQLQGGDDTQSAQHDGAMRAWRAHCIGAQFPGCGCTAAPGCTVNEAVSNVVSPAGASHRPAGNHRDCGGHPSHRQLLCLAVPCWHSSCGGCPIAGRPPLPLLLLLLLSHPHRLLVWLTLPLHQQLVSMPSLVLLQGLPEGACSAATVTHV
jgi:hypothetical protein